ncbi:unnamed protein product [Caenorhabditis angaria]|uniref:G-protein coupled receptors family 1 profile domain-containing protein n=1 Tax=Caenorhabditis angaria TaxID=860376 RepID=A0A9P1IYP0_9PELO|nr:unnamed protein product [Caenorhabditis angaria]
MPHFQWGLYNLLNEFVKVAIRLCTLAEWNPELDQLINFSLLKTYNILPNEIVYHGSYYYNLDSSVNIQNTLITIGVNCMSSGCLLIILICGTKTNIKMKTRRTVSKKFDDLQRQLFRALVIQTIIPFFTMFLPASLILILPIFKITLGSSELLIMVFITTYPLIDPLIVLYIVKDYRKTIFRFVKCVKKNRAIQSSSIIVSNKL